MKLHRILLVLVLKILLISVPVQAQVYTSSNGYVEFISTAPLNEFKGTSNHLAGLINNDKNLVDFYVDLNTIDTGIEKRNRDMRMSYLNTDQYPFAEFTGELISPFDPQRMESQKVTVSGSFKLHGVERQINVDGILKPTEHGLQLDASWIVLLKDYNIERPGILFYELAEEQEVNISILLTESETAEER